MQLEVTSNHKHILKVLKANLSYYESMIKDESSIIEICDFLNLSVQRYKEQAIEEIAKLKQSIQRLTDEV